MEKDPNMSNGQDRDDQTKSADIVGALHQRLTRRRFVMASSATVVVSMLAACGGDDDKPEPTTSTSGETPAANETATEAGQESTSASADKSSSATETSTESESSAEPGGRGGTAVIALIQEPGQMSEFFNGQSGSGLSVLAIEPLFEPDAAGTYQPVLAAEVPTLENGGISDDFLTITYRLKEGVTWSDGEPFTAEDIKFTFDVFMDPGSTTQAGPGYALIESVEVVDPLTAKVTMSGLNFEYLELWRSVLPKHKFESTAVTQEHPLARLPLGTGPYVFSEWKTGDQITLVRNENYRNPDQALLDGITIKITPEKETAIASFIAGDFDTVFFIVTGDLPTVTKAQDEGRGIIVAPQEGPSHVEWLWLNQSDGGDTSKPHPVLGDPAIREAMDLGIDRQSIIEEILGGFGYLVGSFIYSGWASVDIPVSDYDPEKAISVLEAAGWAAGSDGIREKDGVRASLSYQTIAGDQVRELYQQVVQQNMRDIGIEFRIENIPSNTIFGSWEEGGIYRRGDYDILMSRAGYVIDPADWASQFSTEAIPSDENPTGLNRVRYQSAEFDAAIADGAATLDQETRKAAYRRAAEIFAEDRPSLPLYSSAWGWTWNERLKGVSTDFWGGMWPSSATWYIDEDA
ncbi:MAG: peptide ABC transporter substrate-binding protein [Thermomicrobiales bacterium]|nr:peptide ABC transporter substrate-binding protein [Thermomicrobiales bacterium]